MSMGAEEGQKNQLSGESPKEVGFQSHKVASKFFGSKEAIAQEVDDIFHNTFPHFFAPGSGHRIAYNPYESMLVKATETLGLDPALELAFLMRESSTEIFEARRAEKREDEPFDNLFQVVGDIRGEADNNSRQPLGILGSGPKDILYVNLELGPKIHLPKVNPNYCSCEEHPYPMCDGDFCQDHNADIIEGYHFPDAHILCGGEMLAHAECITNTIKGIYEKEVGLFPETGDASIEFVTKRLGKIVPYIAELSVLQAVLFVRQEKRDMDHCILLDDMDASSITRGCFRTTRDIVVCTRSRCSQYNTQRHLRGQKYAHCNDRFSCTIRVREEGMGVQLRWKFVGRSEGNMHCSCKSCMHLAEKHRDENVKAAAKREQERAFDRKTRRLRLDKRARDKAAADEEREAEEKKTKLGDGEGQKEENEEMEDDKA